jgi:hypothetical protein
VKSPAPPPPALRWATLEQLTIDDEPSFKHVALYGDLKAILLRDGYRFRALAGDASGRWDRALFLNLTFWGADAGGDVLHEERIPADVVAHAAWHHLAARALAPSEGAQLSADALFFGEAIASSFDLYLVGRLLGHSPRSTFLETQVPALADAAAAAGLDDDAFDALLQSVAADPDRAFEDLRQLLFDAATTLLGAKDVEAALPLLARFDDHRFGALLHHYELSNWILYARAYARSALEADPTVRALDRELREAKGAVDVLESRWVRPALTAKR